MTDAELDLHIQEQATRTITTTRELGFATMRARQNIRTLDAAFWDNETLAGLPACIRSLKKLERRRPPFHMGSPPTPKT